MTFLDLGPSFSPVPPLGRGVTTMGNIGMSTSTFNPYNPILAQLMDNPLALGPGPAGGYLHGPPIPMGPAGWSSADSLAGSLATTGPRALMPSTLTPMDSARGLVDDILGGTTTGPTATAARNAGGDYLGAYKAAALGPIEQQVVANAGKAWPGKLSMLRNAEGFTGLGKLTIGAGVPIIANQILGPTLAAQADQGGTSGMIFGGLHGALGAGALAGPLLLAGGPAALAGAGIIGVGGLLGAFGHKNKKSDSNDINLDEAIINAGAMAGMSGEQIDKLKATASVLEDAGNSKTDILTSIVAPAIQDAANQQQALTLQNQQMAQYQAQLKAYFDQQQSSIANASGLGLAMAQPYIEQMRADALNRQQLIQQVLDQTPESAKFTDAYRNTVQNSQGALANATNQLADSYAAQIQMAPYLAAQQEQANARAQLEYQMQQALQPQLLQPSYVDQAQQKAQLAALLAAYNKQAKTDLKGGGASSDILAQLTGG